MYTYGYQIVDIAMMIIWSVVALLIYNRPNRQPMFIEYMLCWGCLMVMLLGDFVRWM